jgi:hypothetical protein
MALSIVMTIASELLEDNSIIPVVIDCLFNIDS